MSKTPRNPDPTPVLDLLNKPIPLSYPDPELIMFGRQLAAIESKLVEAYREEDERQAAFNEPPPPPALTIREEDEEFAPKDEEYSRIKFGDPRIWDKYDVHSLRRSLQNEQGFTGNTLHGKSPAVFERAAEIVTAFDDWQKEIAKAAETSGLTQATENRERVLQQFTDTIAELCKAETTSPDGRVLKARLLDDRLERAHHEFASMKALLAPHWPAADELAEHPDAELFLLGRESAALQSASFHADGLGKKEKRLVKQDLKTVHAIGRIKPQTLDGLVFKARLVLAMQEYDEKDIEKEIRKGDDIGSITQSILRDLAYGHTALNYGRDQDAKAA